MLKKVIMLEAVPRLMLFCLFVVVEFIQYSKWSRISKLYPPFSWHHLVIIRKADIRKTWVKDVSRLILHTSCWWTSIISCYDICRQWWLSIYNISNWLLLVSFDSYPYQWTKWNSIITEVYGYILMISYFRSSFIYVMAYVYVNADVISNRIPSLALKSLLV